MEWSPPLINDESPSYGDSVIKRYSSFGDRAPLPLFFSMNDGGVSELVWLLPLTRMVCDGGEFKTGFALHTVWAVRVGGDGKDTDLRCGTAGGGVGGCASSVLNNASCKERV